MIKIVTTLAYNENFTEIIILSFLYSDKKPLSKTAF